MAHGAESRAVGERASRIARDLGWAFSVAVSLGGGVAGCGGGGGGGETRAPTPLEVPAQALPPAEIGVPYAATIAARGGRGPYRFALAAGSPALAAGLSLGADGRIAGTPTASAAVEVRVEVRDGLGQSTATGTVALFVDPPFRVTASAHDGATVEPGEEVAIVLSGGRAPYHAVLAVDASGGTVDVAAERVSYEPGALGPGLADVIDFVDARGRALSLTYQIDGSPFDGFEARYGFTDVWRIRFDVRRGAHAYRSDLERELVALGLRTPGATDLGALHDQLGLMLVERRILGAVARQFGLADDGTDATGSLRISVTPRAPDSGTAPAEGWVIAAQAGRYSVMEVAAQTTDGVLGRAYLDGASNGAIEHDGGTTSQGEPLGVDIAECAAYYRASYGNALAAAPLGPQDVDALRAALRGEAPVGPRAQQIASAVESFAFRIGFVIAHEIGHSVGLAHNTTGGSLMFPSLSFGYGIDPRFTAAEVDQLGFALPGPNRGVAAAIGTGAKQEDVRLEPPVVELRWDGAGAGVACSTCASGAAR